MEPTKLKPWQQLSSKTAFENQWLKVRQDEVKLPDGRVIDDYFIIEVGHYVLVVPYTHDGKFILVRQYKHGAGEIVTEFPAGFIDAGETPEQSAKRELLEETGYSAQKLESLGEIKISPTKDDSHGYLFLATGLTAGQANFQGLEDIEILEVTGAQLRQMIQDGTIRVSDSVTASFLAMEKLGMIKMLT